MMNIILLLSLSFFTFTTHVDDQLRRIAPRFFQCREREWEYVESP